MNRGQNITYLGTPLMFRVPGDKVETKPTNLTELQRTFCIRKDKVAVAFGFLRTGTIADG